MVKTCSVFSCWLHHGHLSFLYRSGLLALNLLFVGNSSFRSLYLKVLLLWSCWLVLKLVILDSDKLAHVLFQSISFSSPDLSHALCLLCMIHALIHLLFCHCFINPLIPTSKSFLCHLSVHLMLVSCLLLIPITHS